MAASPISQVAIIGCGLSGLCLALVLRSHSIPCTIYEKRKSYNQGGSISLFPNSLRILDSLGVYQAIRTQGFPISTSIIKDESFQTIRTVPVCDEARYGYPMLRIPRDAILGVLVDTARERGVDIRFDHRFAHAITTEDTLMSAPVTLVFNNAAPRSASLVVGADGLRSCVRNLTPTFNASPRYTGQSLIAWTVPRRQLRYPVPLSEVPWSMALATRRGMVLFVPEDPDGKRVRVAVQLGLVDREFAAWKALGEKRDVLLEIVRRGGEGVAGAEGDWPDLVASAIEIANADHQMPVFLWPYYTMPMLETWVAGTERLVLLGDAAHVFPPTGGQGAGMAIEDAYGLGMALGEATIWTDVSRVLPQWQRWRQERVQQVAEFSSQVGKSRMALARTDGPVEEDMGWLYGWRLPEDWWHWRQREMPNSSIALGNTPSSSEHLVT